MSDQTQKGVGGSDRTRARRWIVPAAIGGALIGLAVLVYWAFRACAPEVYLSRESLLDLLARQDSRAPIALMALQAAQVILAPIPGHLLGVVSGLAFGLWWGTLYTALGVGAGSAIILGLSRWLGRPLAERFVPGKTLASVDRWAARSGPVFFFLFFMLPFLPDDLACFAVGLSTLPILPMLALIIFARLPGHFVAAWVGATARQPPLWGWIGIVIFAALVFVLYWRHRHKIEAWLLVRLEQAEERRR